MRSNVINSRRTAVLCIVALAAAVIAGRIILVEFFPGAGQFLATIFS